MRRSATRDVEPSAALNVIAATPEPAEHVAHARIKTNAAKQEKKNRFGVKPTIEKVSQKPAYHYGRNEDERQFHGDSSLVGYVFRFLLRRRR